MLQGHPMLYAPYAIDSLLQTRELNLIIVLAAFKAYLSNIDAVKALLLNIISRDLILQMKH